eukprot:2692758-Pyramimonas_sp.AAC.1
MGVGGACGRRHCGLRWSSLWATKRVRGVPELAWLTHADGGTGAFAGAPYGATKRVRGMPKWVWVTHAGGAFGAFGGAPYGATKRVKGVPKW